MLYQCEMCKEKFNSKEELINHIQQTHIKIINDSKEKELQEKLKKDFPTYNITVNKTSSNYEYNIILKNNTIEIMQLFKAKDINNLINDIKVPQTYEQLKAELQFKLELIKLTFDKAYDNNIKIKDISYHYGNYEYNAKIDISIFEGDIIEKEEYTSVFSYYIRFFKIDYLDYLDKLFKKYNVTELEGEWELADDYWNCPNLNIDGIDVTGLLNKARKLGKKVRLSIID